MGSSPKNKSKMRLLASSNHFSTAADSPSSIRRTFTTRDGGALQLSCFDIVFADASSPVVPPPPPPPLPPWPSLAAAEGSGASMWIALEPS